MALVVKQWRCDVTPREDGAYVEIVARQPGLIAWLLALFHIDPRFSLRVNYDKIIYEARSLFGYRRIVLPIASVSSLHFGYAKPWKQVIFWLIMFGLAASVAWRLEHYAAGTLIMLAAVLVAVLIMIFKRSLEIGVREQEGSDYSLELKRSVIEGQEINEQALERITEIVVAIVDRHHDKTPAA
jgi:hypothetical protein